MMRFRLSFLMALMVCWFLRARVAEAQQAPYNGYASERSGGRSSVRIESPPWFMRVNLEFTWHQPFEAIVRVEAQRSAFSSGSGDQIVFSVSGINASCSGPQTVGRLNSGSQMRLEFRCQQVVSGFPVDAVWDFNQPLFLTLRDVSDPVRPVRTWPIGYLRYHAWPLSWDTLDGGILVALMASQHAPGLESFIEEIRRDAERHLGRPLDDSVESRYAAAEAVARFTFAVGMAYLSGGGAYYGRWPVHGTTNFPAETLAYGGGQCDDFAVFGAHLLSALHVPFAIFSGGTHVASAAELVRWHATDPRPPVPDRLAAHLIEHECSGDRCFFLPLDLSVVSETKNTEEMLARGAEVWRQGLFTASAGGAVVISSSQADLVQPFGTLLGRNWLGSSSEVRIVPPRFR